MAGTSGKWRILGVKGDRDRRDISRLGVSLQLGLITLIKELGGGESETTKTIDEQLEPNLCMDTVKLQWISNSLNPISSFMYRTDSTALASSL